jgi:hypothetical protein
MPGAILVYAKHGLVRHPRRCICPLLAGTRSVPLTMWLSGLTQSHILVFFGVKIWQ